MAGVHFNADYGLAIIRPEHQAFYRRVFLHETWSEPRLYPGLVKPVGLMAAHLPTVRERVLVRYPFLRSSAFERRMLFERRNERRSVGNPRTEVRARFGRSAILNKPSLGATSSSRGSSLERATPWAGALLAA